MMVIRQASKGASIPDSKAYRDINYGGAELPNAQSVHHVVAVVEILYRNTDNIMDGDF
jgi:hypothetical protein